MWESRGGPLEMIQQTLDAQLAESIRRLDCDLAIELLETGADPNSLTLCSAGTTQWANRSVVCLLFDPSAYAMDKESGHLRAQRILLALLGCGLDPNTYVAHAPLV